MVLQWIEYLKQSGWMDLLKVGGADELWEKLQGITRTLKRAGHVRPRAARLSTPWAPGQRDFFGEADEFAQPADR
ncbi:hypothetical protein [Burkholderia pyrrocinia]|uniref:hypothetical protein n=1 Tax=Burkholderia pyrrocinia TaxID=60550 RepID=UPI0030D0336A